jgi:hypothetical protein
LHRRSLPTPLRKAKDILSSGNEFQPHANLPEFGRHIAAASLLRQLNIELDSVFRAPDQPTPAKRHVHHIIIAATFSMTTAGYANIENISAVAANANWIPIEAEEDERLIIAFSNANRSFARVARDGLLPSAPTATAVVIDSTPQPVALYLLPADADSGCRCDLATLAGQSRFAPWFWDTSAVTMPELPALNGYAPMPDRRRLMAGAP